MLTFQAHPWIKIVKVDRKSEFGTINLGSNAKNINSFNVERIHCTDQAINTVFDHEEILEDFLDAEFNIHLWEEELEIEKN